MSEAPDAATAWRWLLDRKPHTRGAAHDDLVPIVEAVYAEPRLRALYPFATHGTLKLLRSGPPWNDPNEDDLPYILYGGPPFKVYASRQADLLGEAATPAEAAALVVRHLHGDTRAQG